MALWEKVAADPRPGDVLKFTGGRLEYRCAQGFDPDRGGLVVFRSAVGGDRVTTHDLEPEVWADLAKIACTVERAP